MIFDWDVQPGWTGLGFAWVYDAASEVPPPPGGTSQDDKIYVGYLPTPCINADQIRFGTG